MVSRKCFISNCFPPAGTLCRNTVCALVGLKRVGLSASLCPRVIHITLYIRPAHRVSLGVNWWFWCLMSSHCQHGYAYQANFRQFSVNNTDPSGPHGSALTWYPKTPRMSFRLSCVQAPIKQNPSLCKRTRDSFSQSQFSIMFPSAVTHSQFFSSKVELLLTCYSNSSLWSITRLYVLAKSVLRIIHSLNSL